MTLLTGALVLVLWVGFLVAHPAAAKPTSRAAALTVYESVLEDQRVNAGWTGSEQGCKVGTESAASLQATLRTVNVMRSFAGIRPVAFKAAKNQKALAAALMMKAEGDLSHEPGPGWACYSAAGAEGAGHSNLFLGASGADAVVGYVDDEGIDSLGHRRWILDPGAMEFGSGSTGSTNALFVLDNRGNGSNFDALDRDELVAWPAPGWMPWPWVFRDWSLAIGDGSESVELGNAQVRVEGGGTELAVSHVTALDDGYGTGRTLSWRVAVPAALQAGDRKLDVTISGVRFDNSPMPISYSVSAFAPGGDPGAGPACEKAKRQFETARKKLRKAKRSGREGKIKRARKKVERKRALVAELC